MPYICNKHMCLWINVFENSDRESRLLSPSCLYSHHATDTNHLGFITEYKCACSLSLSFSDCFCFYLFSVSHFTQTKNVVDSTSIKNAEQKRTIWSQRRSMDLNVIDPVFTFFTGWCPNATVAAAHTNLKPIFTQKNMKWKLSMQLKCAHASTHSSDTDRVSTDSEN